MLYGSRSVFVIWVIVICAVSLFFDGQNDHCNIVKLGNSLSEHADITKDALKRLFSRFIAGTLQYFYKTFGTVERIVTVVCFGDTVGVQKQMRFSSMGK